MAPSAIDEILSRHPTGPLRITLSSGDKIDIPSANAAVVSISHIFLFPNLKRHFTADMGRYISVINIAMIEPLPEVSAGEASNN